MERMLPRIAYFPDSYHAVNGVAHTSRNFVAYAERKGVPFLCVRAGEKTAMVEHAGEVRALELERSVWSIPMERDLEFDLLFARHGARVERTLKEFRPDVIHISGPSEFGMLGAYFAWKLRVPLVASWHTNVHEYAARRMHWAPRTAQRWMEEGVLEATARFYRLARVLYAPNVELCALLERKTGRPCHLMQRGVETEVFTPAKRTRAAGMLRLGYVGRFSVEKNVALLPRIDAGLRARGVAVEWAVIGHGAEEALLREKLGDAAVLGVLRGEDLARAYADMDLFVFPSHTDTFGNVVLEALASGVPAIVTPDGGPAHIVQEGVTGRVVEDAGFAGVIAELATDQVGLARMRVAAREYALGCSWDSVFDRVVGAYPVGGSESMS